MPTRTQISDYATKRGLVVGIIISRGQMIVHFEPTIDFRIRQAMAVALAVDHRVLHAPRCIIFYE